MGDTVLVMLPVVSHEARTGRWPYVTICLIGVNVLVFAFALSMGARFVPFLQDWGLIPARVNADVSLHNLTTAFTSLFLHAGVLHLATNMWFLYVFGDAVEDAFGGLWFLVLYLLSGFLGNMAFVATHPDDVLPGVGASGAVCGVMAASLVLWPRARLRVPGILLVVVCALFVYQGLVAAGLGVRPTIGLLTVLCVGLGVLVVEVGGGVVQGLILGVDLPAWFVLGMYFGLQVLNGIVVLVAPEMGGGVGWWAHVGGALAGAVFAFVFPRSPVALRREVAQS